MRRLGDGECDDLCNNARNEFDNGDCREIAMTAPEVPIENDYLNGNGYADTDERDALPVVGAFNVCPREWIGNGECDAVCNVTRYNYDCSQPRQGYPRQCDCDGVVQGAVVPMPHPTVGPGATCSAESNIEILQQHCEAVGGRCTGKDGECNGVIRGKCGPDCFCCVGRHCDDRYRGDGICDQECNTAELMTIKRVRDRNTGEYMTYKGDGRCDADGSNCENDCKGADTDAFRSQDAACPAAWKGDGECDLECRWVPLVVHLQQNLRPSVVADFLALSLCIVLAH